MLDRNSDRIMESIDRLQKGDFSAADELLRIVTPRLIELARQMLVGFPSVRSYADCGRPRLATFLIWRQSRSVANCSISRGDLLREARVASSCTRFSPNRSTSRRPTRTSIFGRDFIKPSSIYLWKSGKPWGSSSITARPKLRRRRFSVYPSERFSAGGKLAATA